MADRLKPKMQNYLGTNFVSGGFFNLYFCINASFFHQVEIFRQTSLFKDLFMSFGGSLRILVHNCTLFLCSLNVGNR